MTIHPTAIIEDGVELGENVIVRPFTVIETGAIIGDDCEIGPHAVIRGPTTLGSDCQVRTGAVLGEPPQDAKYGGEETRLIIGDRNIIREYTTLHRATGEGNSTVVGDDNMLMAYTHAGHNCRLGSNILVANSAGISGHVTIEDNVNIGGLVGIHQYATIGRGAMVGGMSKVVRDVPPFCMVDGHPAEVRALNTRGLQRQGVSSEDRMELQRAFRLVYRSEYNTTEALQIIADELRQTDEIRYFTDFLRAIEEGYAGRQNDPH